MSWISDRLNSKPKKTAVHRNVYEMPFEARAAKRWDRLMNGFQRDVEEYRAFGRDAEFRQLSDVACRISNPTTNTAVAVTADLAAHTIEYSYEPETENTPVPDGGMLTIRPSNSSAELYSADQRLTSRQARQLILQPLLFPAMPSDPGKTGT